VVALPIPAVLAVYQDRENITKKSENAPFFCHSCGKEVGFLPGKPPCEALEGWLTVSHWKGPRAVEQRSFCSFNCLRRWVDIEVPKVPKAFLKSFGEKDETPYHEKGEQNGLLIRQSGNRESESGSWLKVKNDREYSYTTPCRGNQK
jgi:hypothetical protein